MTYLPEKKSFFNYKGEWNPATNTPQLADGNGEVGNLYKVNSNATVNLGSGDIKFTANDYVLYNTNNEWERWNNPNVPSSIFQTTSTYAQDINATLKPIPLDELIYDNNNFSLSNGQVTINESGRYLVYVSLAYEDAGSRVNPRIRFRLNGNILEGEGLTGYVRRRSGHNEGSNNLSRIIDVNAGDVLEVITDRIADNGNATLRPNESIFYGIKINEDLPLLNVPTLNGFQKNDLLNKDGPLKTNSLTIDTNISLSPEMKNVFVNANENNIEVITLDARNYKGLIQTITRVDSSSNMVIIGTQNEQYTINGSLDFGLQNQYNSITIQSDGANWYIIQKNTNTIQSDGPTEI
jgi:hypothetical protein